MQTCIVAECYGNACIGEYLKGELGGRVFYKPDYGRERILRNVIRWFKQRCGRLLEDRLMRSPSTPGLW